MCNSAKFFVQLKMSLKGIAEKSLKKTLLKWNDWLYL